MLALQELDMRIRNLKLRLSMLPVEKEKLSSENVREQEAMKEAKTKMQKTELEIKQLEAAIQKENSEILRFQGQSIMVKKNEEYKVGNRKVQIKNRRRREQTNRSLGPARKRKKYFQGMREKFQ